MQDDGHFDAEVAATYDAVHGGDDPDQVKATVDVLQELAAGGRALEFAVGTGRIALPLRARGVDVAGIELSNAMVAELRKKERGAPMEIAIGDMSTTGLEGPFSLVFLVFNTIDNLITQDAQIACFRNAFSHLSSAGRFVVETLVPPLQRIPFGETKRAFACSDEHWGIDVFDPVSQTYTSNHVYLSEHETRTLSLPFRYAWPAEFDVMAKWAGFELEHRWADWQKAPFTHLSQSHVSVWKKPVH